VAYAKTCRRPDPARFPSIHPIPRDNDEAVKWYREFNLAASNLFEAEKRNMAASNMDLIASKMTTAQIAEAQRMATEWKPKEER